MAEILIELSINFEKPNRDENPKLLTNKQLSNKRFTTLNPEEMKILVCEDDYMVIKAIEHKLTREGYEVDIANDGRMAKEKLKTQFYDLVITDLLMPFNGGLELINMMKNELKKETPIIVLSKVGNEETIIEAFKLGADDYLTKPFSPNELSIRVKRFLIRR